MIETHEKLTKGIPIDPHIVSSLILSGIINIVNQHDAIKELKERVQSCEQTNVSNQSRLKNLESWVLRQNESIQCLVEKLSTFDENGVVIKETKEIENMKKKIVSLEINLNTVKSGRNRANNLKTKPSESPGRKKLRCGDCDQTFLKNCDLEKLLT